jgi:myo-inositol-1(or 4)-monophosphatase
MTESSHREILERIHSALEAARTVFSNFTPGEIQAEYKAGHDPVTEADRAVDAVLRRKLLRDHEGWLSEESIDDLSRLEKKQVWIVDPLDGTREFVAGIPEFCASVAFVEGGVAIAGGICNPATGELFLGSLQTGMTYNGQPVRTTGRVGLDGATILASRSETKRGEWKQFETANFDVRPMGSVAYKLALVAAGLADATFTFVPKHEWDVAGGAALVASAGGFVSMPDGQPLRCNNRSLRIPGLLAGTTGLREELLTIAARQVLK